MNLFPHLIVVSAICAIAPFAATAQTPTEHPQTDVQEVVEPPPIAIPKAAELLKELQELRKVVPENRSTRAVQMVKFLRDASRSTSAALEAHEKAFRAVQFAGAHDSTAQFRAWEDKHGERLKDSNFRAALKAQLEYLALSIEAKAKSVEEILPAVVRFANVVMANPEWLSDFGGKNKAKSPLMEPIQNTVFTKYLNLHALLNTEGDWHPVPGEPIKIYEASILPIWRKQKNPALLEFWERKINTAGEAAKESRRDYTMERFKNFTLPELRWARAQEYLHLDRHAEAVQEMLAVLRTARTHPQFDVWGAELEALLKSAAP